MVREDITFDEVAEFFSLPIVEASSRLGVCNATLKRICRENGIPRWPYRKVMAGRTIQEIKEEAAQNLASIKSGGAALDEDEEDADVGGGALPSRGQPRESLGNILRITGPAPKQGSALKRAVRPGGQAQVLPSQQQHQTISHPPIFKSIFAQSAVSPPGFPFPYPIPLPKRQATEQRWKQPSFLQEVDKNGFSEPLSSSTRDLWSPVREQPVLAGADNAGRTSGVSGPGGASMSAEGDAPGQKCIGFDAEVFEALAEVKQIRQRQADRFSRGMRCAMSRGYQLPLEPQDQEALDFVFGEYVPQQWCDP